MAHVNRAWLSAAGITILLALAVTVVGRVPAWPVTGRLAVPRAAGGSAAAADADRCMRASARVLHDARAQAGLPLDPGAPADEAAWIGSELTPLVTTLGSLDAKREASAAAWGGALAAEFTRHGVGAGSVIAANFSGSFPALNAAVVCAAQAIGARVAAASSVTASTWGASDPGFTWPELEARLVRAGIVRPATVVISIGGAGDRGLDLDDDARALAAGIGRRAARALGAAWLEPKDHGDAVRARLLAFEHAADGQPLSAFVNVGGAEAGVGRSPAILQVPGGWITSAPAGLDRGNGGLVGEFLARGTPVLHLLNVRALALRWGIR